VTPDSTSHDPISVSYPLPQVVERNDLSQEVYGGHMIIPQAFRLLVRGLAECGECFPTIKNGAGLLKFRGSCSSNLSDIRRECL
jgi:hypothetical protein